MSSHKVNNDIPVSALLVLIENVMQRAEQITENAATEHLHTFKQQMREKLGVDEIALDEPYLPAFLKQREVHFMESLDKLFDQVDRLAPEKSAKSVLVSAPWLFEYKALRFDEPLLPQIEERLNMETIRYTRHLKQGLDGFRQQAAGIAKYIWRTVGDDRVRPSHAANEGKIFEWGVGESPGRAFGCRCSAEPILDDAGQPTIQANPLGWAAVIAAAIARRAAILRRVGARRAERIAQEATKPKPTPPKPAEVPKTPAKPKLDVAKRPDGVPKDWKQSPSRNEKGVRYRDPKNQHNEVRVQKGDPNSSYKNSKEPYVRWKKDGQWLDKNGKQSREPENTHIPIEDFKFDPEVFK